MFMRLFEKRSACLDGRLSLLKRYRLSKSLTLALKLQYAWIFQTHKMLQDIYGEGRQQ
jgi:hypothetical protein